VQVICQPPRGNRTEESTAQSIYQRAKNSIQGLVGTGRISFLLLPSRRPNLTKGRPQPTRKGCWALNLSGLPEVWLILQVPPPSFFIQQKFGFQLLFFSPYALFPVSSYSSLAPLFFFSPPAKPPNVFNRFMREVFSLYFFLVSKLVEWQFSWITLADSIAAGFGYSSPLFCFFAGDLPPTQIITDKILQLSYGSQCHNLLCPFFRRSVCSIFFFLEPPPVFPTPPSSSNSFHARITNEGPYRVVWMFIAFLFPENFYVLFRPGHPLKPILFYCGLAIILQTLFLAPPAPPLKTQFIPNQLGSRISSGFGYSLLSFYSYSPSSGSHFSVFLYSFLSFAAPLMSPPFAFTYCSRTCTFALPMPFMCSVHFSPKRR